MSGIPKMTFDYSDNILITAPFFHSDEGVNGNLDFEFIPDKALVPRTGFTWCSTSFYWDDCPPDEKAGTILYRNSVGLNGYDRFCICLTTSDQLILEVSLLIDGTWTERIAFESEKRRFEIILPVEGQKLEEVKIYLIPRRSGAREVSLAWFGLLKEGFEMDSLSVPRRFDQRWSGLIREDGEWGAVKFARGLLFDESLLDELREKRNRPYWKEHYQVLKEDALRTMEKNPESMIGKFIPWSDGRYQFTFEISPDIFFFEPLTLAVVGLVEENRDMQKMALRYLMSYLFTEHWTQSENRMCGATWDQRCFLEEMSSSCVSLLADWFDFALTDHGRELVRKSLWDKGLSIVERDLMKHDYMWTMNQGAWFCRARILGGLLLEKAWPRMGQYVDRAYEDMIEILDSYILEDGGTDEGAGYFSLTMGVCLEGIIAYARARNRTVGECLPKNIDACESFVSTMSGVKPGNVLMDGDNSFDRFIGNTIPLLASIYPESNYGKILGNLLGHPKPDTYYSQYVPHMELGFVLGPDFVDPPETIVPTFNVLEKTGHLTSFREREGLSIRIHLAGAKAFASHTHFDKGSFTLEVNSEPVLIDRGVIRYDDPSGGNIKATECHNALTPVLEGGCFPVQESPTEAIIPRGAGDEKGLDCSIDIANAWRAHMHGCVREIRSDSLTSFQVVDRGILKEPSPVAFHLHSLYPFNIDGKRAVLETDSIRLVMDFDYAESIKTYEHLIDHQYRPVNHLEVRSALLEDFEITTIFRIEER